MNNKYKNLVLMSALLAVVVVGLGAYTRLSDAGLGCPDWPGCYGFLTAPSHISEIPSSHQSSVSNFIYEAAKAWKEMIHRYFAGSLGLMLLAVFAFSLMINKNLLQEELPQHNASAIKSRIPIKLPTILLLLVIFQAVLGMLTVTMQLQPLIVMGHLLGGFSILSLLGLLYLRLTKKPLYDNEKTTSGYISWCFVALTVLIMQIALGGWLAANYAAPFCNSLPLCSGGWNEGNWQQTFSISEVFQLPAPASNYEFGVLSSEARMSIHLLHRFWAIVTATVVLCVAARIYFKSQNDTIKNSALLVAFAVLFQVSLGAILVYWHFPISIALAHNLMAAMLLLSLIRLTYFINQLRVQDKTRLNTSGDK
ncbi:MAG: COX15/CtaA family protein [Psychromonas sp.]